MQWLKEQRSLFPSHVTTLRGVSISEVSGPGQWGSSAELSSRDTDSIHITLPLHRLGGVVSTAWLKLGHLWFQSVGRGQSVEEGWDPAMAHIILLTLPWQELSHVAISTCKVFWEM